MTLQYTVYYIGNNIEDTLDGLNRIAEDLNQWSVKNKLCTNSEKTEAMIISLRPFIGLLRPLRYGNKYIKFISKSKCLGLTINNSLRWNRQVEHMVKSYGAKLSQLNRIKHLPKHVLEQICYKSIIANMYCITVQGTCSPSLFYDLEWIHIRAA